jgi:hypothetical protein
MAAPSPMLQKLRSRHPVDLPYGTWGRKRGILTILGGLAVLFVVIPLVLSPLVQLGASTRKAVVLVGAGVFMLLFALLMGAIRGKTGWDR